MPPADSLGGPTLGEDAGKKLSANCAVSLTTVSLPEPTKEGDRGETEEGNTAQIAELSAQEVLRQFQADQQYPRCGENCTGSIQPHGHRGNIETKCDSRCALFYGPGCGGALPAANLFMDFMGVCEGVFVALATPFCT